MKVTVDTGSGLQRFVSVEVDSDVVSRMLDKVARELARRANIPGGYVKFKAKLARVKMMFRKEIGQEAALLLVEETAGEVLESEGLDVIGAPRVIRHDAATYGQPLTYTVLVEIRPQVPAPMYRGLYSPEIDVEVTSEDVDAMLERLRQRNARLVPFGGDRLEDGLWVGLRLEPETPDEEIRKKLMRTPVLEVGEGELGGLLHGALCGHPVGEPAFVEAALKDMPLAQGQDEELAGRVFRWRVEVREAKLRVVPELDDAFATQVKGFKSLLALRGDVREELTKAKEAERENAVEEALLTQLLVRNRVEIPALTVSDMYRKMAEEIDKRYEEMRGSVADELVDRLVGREKEVQAEQAVRWTQLAFIIGAVAKAEGIEVTEVDLEERLRERAESEGVALEYLKGKLGKVGVETERSRLLRDRALRRVRELAIRVSEDDFMAMMRAPRRRRRMLGRHRRRVVRCAAGMRRRVERRGQ